MLQDKAMLIRPSWSRPAARKTDRKASEATALAYGAKATRFNATKRLWEGSVYDKIVSLDNAADRHIKFLTRPWLDDGWRVVPTAIFFDLTDYIRDYKDKRESLVGDFMNELDQIKQNEQQALGTAYNEEDYAVDRGKFGFDLIFMPIPKAGDFRAEGLDPEDIAKIEAETLSRIQDQFKSTDLWKRVHDAVSHISERLHAYEIDPVSGKVNNRFHDTLINNLRNLVSVLPKLNITGDAELDAMAKTLDTELCYYDPQALRDNDIIRKDVATKADQILAEVSAFMA